MAQPTNPHPEPNPFKGTQAHAVASLIHHGAPDDAGRTMATAMLTLSLWQMAPGPITATVPSVLLVNAGDAASDPLDAFMEDHVFGLGMLEERLQNGDTEKDMHCPGNADKCMKLAAWSAKQLASIDGSSGEPNLLTEQYRQQFENYRRRDFGSGPAFRYARAWTEDYGWLSGRDNRLVLRLDHADDRKLLRNDVLTGASRLHQPKGFNRELALVPKTLALSGSLNSLEWDEPLVTRLLTTGWPVLFLPHTVMNPLLAESRADLALAVAKVGSYPWKTQVTAEDAMPDDDRVNHFQRTLLGRLAYMPMNYGFTLQRVTRELGGVCTRMAIVIGDETRNPDVIAALGQDMFRHTLRAIVIGVFGLAYYGWGFDAGCPREEVVALLHYVRSHGPVRRRDVQRRFPALTPNKRDALLARLEDEGLIECRGYEVSAVPLSDFIEQLQARQEFPQAGVLSALVLGQKCPLADPVPGMKEKTPRRRRRRKDVSQDGDAPASQTSAEEGADEGTAATEAHAEDLACAVSRA